VLSLKRDLYTIIVFIKYLLSDSPTSDFNDLHVGENTNMGGVYIFGLCWCYRSNGTLHHYYFCTNLLSDSPTSDFNDLHVGENTNMGGGGFKAFLLVKTPTRALCFSCW
jgi:hypothetical protein